MSVVPFAMWLKTRSEIPASSSKVDFMLRMIASEEVEVLALLPFAHFEVEAGDLGFLETAEIIDKRCAEPVAQALVGAQRLQSTRERRGQPFCVRFIRRIGWRPGIELLRDAVEAGVDLWSGREGGGFGRGPHAGLHD